MIVYSHKFFYQEQKKLLQEKIYINMFTFSPNLAHGFLIPIISGIPDSET